jgi:hypothetical protein
MAGHPTFDQVDQRIAAYARIERERPLTQAECADLDRLHARRTLRLSRLPNQIAATREKLERLLAIYQGKAAA